ncbi:DUF1090 family protein [Pantoea cypripedii]|uniref:DUF1090 family protein n=1 Tax=Pantoea cypripedii TaxID=55209 RepID=UPI002FCA35B1
MKMFLTLPLVAFTVASHASEQTQSCEQREAALQRQMGYAQEYNNRHEIAGLERAITEVKRHCRNSASRNGNAEEIRRREREVKELRQKLADAEDALDDARNN